MWQNGDVIYHDIYQSYGSYIRGGVKKKAGVI
jgi:hypothetical protein